MKIVSIDIFHLKVPLKQPYKLSKAVGTILVTEPIVVRVNTDEGVIGFGETDPLLPFTEETPSTVKVLIQEVLAPALIGLDPIELNRINKVMDSASRGNLLAKAALDMACHDILGKYHNSSLSVLFGGKLREEIPLMGAVGTDQPENNAEDVVHFKRQGYASVMVKVGSLSIEEDAQRIYAIRDAVGSEFPLVVDANQGWDPITAIRFCRLIEGQNIAFLEQPVPAWDIEGLCKVKQHTTIPISADESLFTINDAIRLIKHGAVDFFSIKVAKNGGIKKTKQIMTLAEAFGIPCLMNSMIEEGITQAASLQLGVTFENVFEYGNCYFSPLRLQEDITDFSQNISKGKVRLPGGPGLGITVHEDVINKYKIDEFRVKC